MKEALTPQVKVSVVMCTYNGEKYLREQIESILNQTCPVYELISRMTVLPIVQLKLSANTSRRIPA